MFSPNLPPGAVFELLDFSDQPPPAARPEEEALLSGTAVPRRRDQLRAGRAAARAVLLRLGFDPPPAVLHGERGEPLWPAAVCGTITHCNQLAAAAAAPAASVRALGIDLESCARGLKQDISPHVCLPAEQVWAAALPEQRVRRLITLFSAKESIYKALFPLGRRFFGFQDVELTPSDDAGFSARLLTTLSAELPEGFTLQVHWQSAGDYILTYTWLTPAGR